MTGLYYLLVWVTLSPLNLVARRALFSLWLAFLQWVGIIVVFVHNFYAVFSGCLEKKKKNSAPLIVFLLFFFFFCSNPVFRTIITQLCQTKFFFSCCFLFFGMAHQPLKTGLIGCMPVLASPARVVPLLPIRSVSGQQAENTLSFRGNTHYCAPAAVTSIMHFFVS